MTPGYKIAAATVAGLPPPDELVLRHGELVKRIIEFYQTGVAPVSPEETVETLAFMEAADLSKARNGAAVKLSDVAR